MSKISTSSAGYSSSGVSALGERTLALVANVGATVLTLNEAAAVPAKSGFVAVEPFTSSCEIRRVNSVNSVAKTATLDAALTRSHSPGAAVLFWNGDGVPAGWFGALLDGSTNDEVALQWGMREATRYGHWLDGENRTAGVSFPLIVPAFGKVRNLNLSALAGYSPANTAGTADDGSNGALLMNMQGQALTFTSDGSTTLTATGLGFSAGSHARTGLVFKTTPGGPSLPPELVYGRVYYVENVPSTDHFTVSATRGGAAIAVSASSGSTVFTEVLSLSKQELEKVIVNGQNRARNGIAMSLQQQSYFIKVRAQNCLDAALVLNGQQAEFFECELNSSPTALALENASFMYFFGVNLEGTNTSRGIHSRPTASLAVFDNAGGVGGATSCVFAGTHFECQTITTSTCVDMEGQSVGLEFLTMVANSNNGSQRIFYAHTGSIGSSSYRVTNLWLSGASSQGTNTPILLEDVERGVTGSKVMRALEGPTAGSSPGPTITRRYVAHLEASLGSTSSATLEQGVLEAAAGGGFEAHGGQQVTFPRKTSQAGASQSGALHLYRDENGRAGGGFDAKAYPMVAKPVAPTATDIRAGRALLYYENATLKWRGKKFGAYVTTDYAASQFTTVDATGTPVAHGFASNAQVYLSGDSLPGGFSTNTAYFVRTTADPNVFELSASTGPGSLKAMTSHGGVNLQVSGENTSYDAIALDAGLLDAKGDLIAASAADTPVKVSVGSDGQVLTADAASAGGVKWASAGGADTDTGIRRMTHPSGKWEPAWAGTVQGVGALNNLNTLNLVPMFVDGAWTIDRVGVWVQTGVTSAMLRVGLYASDGTAGVPGTLIEDFGQIDCTTTGTSAYFTVTPSGGSRALAAQTRYWLGVVPQGALPNVQRSVPLVGMGVYFPDGTPLNIGCISGGTFAGALSSNPTIGAGATGAPALIVLRTV